jgi:1-acyl-sn-glycerol-3-phosphate acyltransferase
MIKLLWYTYFAIYLLFKSISFIKLSYLRKKDKKAAEVYAYNQVRQISRFVLKKSKTVVEVKGIENIPEGACVFVANHQAIFDAFLLMAYIDKITGFIAKKEIKKIPLINRWLIEIGTVYLDRENIKEGIKTINEGAKKLLEGRSMIIFPEGTRSLCSEMGEFKKGSLKLATKANAPIVPVTIDGTYRVLEVGNKVTGNKVKINFHRPIYTDQLSKDELKGLTEVTYNIIESTLEKMKNEN